MAEVVRTQRGVPPIWLLVLDVVALYLGSFRLLLWMAPPSSMTYLVTPVALALVHPLALLLIVFFLTAIVVLSFRWARAEYWWLVPVGSFFFALAHAEMAIEVFHGLAG